MRKSAIASIVAIVTLGACTQSPTGTAAASPQDQHPRYDFGGGMGGSGNFTGTAPSTLAYNTTVTENEVTAADSVTSRGGVFGGSGN
jgi:hypothetical protein